jgi:hypothetical protein
MMPMTAKLTRNAAYAGHLVPQRFAKVSKVVGRANRQHQQRDCDREHAVTERLQARLTHRGSVTG